MERDLWINYAFACCAIVLSSGAGAGLAMCRGASYGPPWASAAIVGQVLGLATILIAAGVGVGSLLMASARTFRAVKLCGAAYLVQWRAPAATRTSTARATPEASWGKRRASEFRTYAANPKGIVFVVAVLPQFIVAGKPLVSPIAVVTITMCVFDAAITHAYAYGASVFGRVFKHPRTVRIQNRVLEALLKAAGTAIGFVRRAVPA